MPQMKLNNKRMTQMKLKLEDATIETEASNIPIRYKGTEREMT